MAATGATELLLRFCDRSSSPCYPTSSSTRAARSLLTVAVPLPWHRRHPPLYRATLSCTPPPVAESLDFIPAPQRESIVKRQRRDSTCRASVGQTSFVSSPAERDFLRSAAVTAAGKICAWLGRLSSASQDRPRGDHSVTFQA